MFGRIPKTVVYMPTLFTGLKPPLTEAEMWEEIKKKKLLEELVPVSLRKAPIVRTPFGIKTIHEVAKEKRIFKGLRPIGAPTLGETLEEEEEPKKAKKRLTKLQPTTRSISRKVEKPDGLDRFYRGRKLPDWGLGNKL